MTDNNNNGNGDPTKEKKKLRTQQEIKVLAEFTIVLQHRVDKIRNELGSNGKIGMSEKEIDAINSLVNGGNMEAIIAGVATFVFLRRFPIYLRQRAAKRAATAARGGEGSSAGGGGGRSSGGGGGGGYTLDSPPLAGGGRQQQQPLNSPFRTNNNNSNSFQNNLRFQAQQQQQQQEQQQFHHQQQQGEQQGGGLIWRGFSFMLDLTISGLVGIQVGIYMMDTERMKRTVTDIPLLEGQSALSDNFCGVLVDEYKKQYRYNPNNNISSNSSNNDGTTTTTTTMASSSSSPPPLQPFDRKDILKNPELEPLKVLMGFTKNCMKRQAMERRIRQERGMRQNEKVSIPYPGVVVGLSNSSSSEWNSSSGSGGGFGGFDADAGDDDDDDTFFSSSSHDNNNGFYNNDNEEWTKEDVSSFVSDQDNDNNSKDK